MDELNNGEQGQYVEPGKNEKKNNTRKIVKRSKFTSISERKKCRKNSKC